MAEKEKDAGSDGKKKSKLKLIIVLALVVISAVAVSVGATLYFLTDRDDSDDPSEAVTEEASGPAEASYFVFDQPFVVSLAGERQRYLQVHLAVVMRDHDVTAQLDRHSPTIRSRLQSMLARQRFDDLQTDEAREALRVDMLEIINGVMAEEEAEAVEQVLYTNFVMQ